MVVGLCELEFYIPGSSSLKEKRFVLRSLKDRLHKRLNVSVSEAEHHDKWQRSTLCVVTVSNSAAVVHSVLAQAQKMLQGERRIELLDVRVELR